jgi:dihydrofolate synthase/folylpolyglutamate synthase
MYHRIGAAAYKANLNNTWELMKLLNYPYKNFKSIHIAGTNGKGSSSHMLASVLQVAGYKTGLYTSPHLKDFRERIKINGELIPQKFIVEFVDKYKFDFEKIKPSFFEWTVALAFSYFAQQQVDIAVIEVGLGGRLDSTNVITPIVSLITNIGFDHMNLLGNTLSEIAFEKAGIIKPSVPVVISEHLPETEQVFNEIANKNKAPIYYMSKMQSVRIIERTNFYQKIEVTEQNGSINVYELDLPGTYQQENCKGVLGVIEILKKEGYPITDFIIKEGLRSVKKNTGLMGRWQIISLSPLVVADTGHNKDGIQWVLENIKLTPHHKLHIVWGMVNDKDISSVLGLLPTSALYYFCKPAIPRGLDVELLYNEALKFNLNGKVFRSVKEALAAALAAAKANDFIFVGGSTFVVAEVV